ncbi:hypothetical protein Avbf_12880 [Armadillidium vulgare]|nr:hypothetical protein Avbf_12880 [Armadillidium vulgare]
MIIINFQGGFQKIILNRSSRDFKPKDASLKRSENPRNRVNYDYHPIIDFFEVSTLNIMIYCITFYKHFGFSY